MKIRILTTMVCMITAVSCSEKGTSQNKTRAVQQESTKESLLKPIEIPPSLQKYSGPWNVLYAVCTPEGNATFNQETVEAKRSDQNHVVFNLYPANPRPDMGAKAEFRFGEVNLGISYNPDRMEYILGARGTVSDGDDSYEVTINDIPLTKSADNQLRGSGTMNSRGHETPINAILNDNNRNFDVLFTTGPQESAEPTRAFKNGLDFLKERPYILNFYLYHIATDDVFYMKFEKQQENTETAKHPSER